MFRFADDMLLNSAHYDSYDSRNFEMSNTCEEYIGRRRRADFDELLSRARETH